MENNNVTGKRMHLLCNAHIDPSWLWNWEEGAAATISTFRTAVRFCKEYDEFIFNHNESLLYEWIEEYDPDLFEEIKELIHLGKWHVMGGWYLQPDCNMPSGESFVRQIEEGRRYFMEKFGVDGGKTAINFDPFGHTIGLVQILKDAGYDNYIVTRPAKLIYNQQDIHDNHIKWVGYNNKSINVFKGSGYLSRLGEVEKKFESVMNLQGNKNDLCVLWGVGNHGGGPSKVDLDKIRVMTQEGKNEIIHTTPDEYFEAYNKHNEYDLTLKKSLHSHSVGCYTSMALVKKKHRDLENKLLLCEKIMSHAVSSGYLEEYDHEMLRTAWKNLLFCQFHDALPGTSIQIVENDILKRLDHGLDIVEKLIFRSYFRLVKGQKAAKDGEYPILVYNPHPYKITTSVECEYMMAESNRDQEKFFNADVYDEKGNKLLSQNEKEQSNVPIDWGKKVVFYADLEPMSVNRFNMVNKLVNGKPYTAPKEDDSYIYFSNENMQTSINKKTGLLDSYKINGKEYIKPNSCRLLVIQDNCDSWGMTVDSYKKIKGRFKLATPKQTAKICGVEADELAPVRVIESSGLRTIIEACFTYAQSSCVMTYTFNQKDNKVGVNARIFSFDKSVMYKLSIPTVLTRAKCIGKTAYGRDNLMTNGNENVSHQWLMLKQAEDAFAVINNSNYGSSTSRGELRMSVMRTPGYSAHPWQDRQILPEDRFSPRIDIGERLFDYWFEAGNYDEINSKVDQDALLLHQKPIVLNFNPSEEGEKAQALCLVDNPSVELVTARKNEQGDGFTFRLFNNLEKKNTFNISVPIYDISKQYTLKPFEILTLNCTDKGLIKKKLV